MVSKYEILTNDEIILQYKINKEKERARNREAYERLKVNIETLQNAEKTIGNLRGVRYQWRSSGQSDIGFIAQEVANWIPEAVTSNENEIYVAYDKVIPFLVESVKGLLQRVEVLEEKLREVSR
jgi:hypothetical protein